MFMDERAEETEGNCMMTDVYQRKNQDTVSKENVQNV